MNHLIDQLKIGDKASFDDFFASVATRTIGQPKKKVIKETVPFSNITYDFSAINGEVYWEERELEYVFEITAPTPEKLEELKADFSSWIMNVMNAELHDPFIPDFHFLATYDDMEFEDEEGLEKTTATVVFMAYPYKVANLPRVYEVEVAASKMEEIAVENKSSHPVAASIIIGVSENDSIEEVFEKKMVMWVNNDESSETVINAYEETAIMLPRGVTMFQFGNVNESAETVKISFYEEVF